VNVVAIILLVACLVFAVVAIFQGIADALVESGEKESEFEKKENEYKATLSLLQNKPSNSELRNKVIELGRWLIQHDNMLGEDEIKFQRRRQYSEQSLANDLTICLSGRSESILEPKSVADEIKKLGELVSSNIITREEFERGKSLFLGSPPDKSQKILDVLANLHRLRQQGALSESEYNMKKWDLLSGKLV